MIDGFNPSIIEVEYYEIYIGVVLKYFYSDVTYVLYLAYGHNRQ